jgi:hypothetical protein
MSTVSVHERVGSRKGRQAVPILPPAIVFSKKDSSSVLLFVFVFVLQKYEQIM